MSGWRLLAPALVVGLLGAASTASAGTRTGTTGVSAERPIRLEPERPRLGDLLIVYAHDQDSSVNRVVATAFGHDVVLFRINDHSLRGVFAVPLELEARSHELAIHFPSKTVRGWIDVQDREFPLTTLKVSKRFTDKVTPKLERRQKKEDQLWDEMFELLPTRPKFVGSIHRPVPGRFTAPFGTKRTFNGALKTRHLGLDLAGMTGDPIYAAQAGVVVMSSMRFTYGGTLVIDHGNGLFTAYFHMSEREPEVGDWVEAGERIGAVGASGRVTGPHLHLAVLVRMDAHQPDGGRRAVGAWVDPEPFLALRFDGHTDFLETAPEEADIDEDEDEDDDRLVRVPGLDPNSVQPKIRRPRR